MYDLDAMFARRAVYALDALEAAEIADRVYEESVSGGPSDFGDRCYYEDRARDAAHDSHVFDLGFAALLSALEA